MTTDEKSENSEIIIPIWNRSKPDHLCNRGVMTLTKGAYESIVGKRENAVTR